MTRRRNWAAERASTKPKKPLPPGWIEEIRRIHADITAPEPEPPPHCAWCDAVLGPEFGELLDGSKVCPVCYRGSVG